ncbi:hypothetical protein [Rhodospirillum centenum]|uniref:hypothetical protein n=1 Tax=Rhodospirillum centenum TaxID=34018 RepID=UPI000673D81E|nr:hypothetical protein [Rhodospirillum centenum]
MPKRLTATDVAVPSSAARLRWVKRAAPSRATRDTAAVRMRASVAVRGVGASEAGSGVRSVRQSLAGSGGGSPASRRAKCRAADAAVAPAMIVPFSTRKMSPSAWTASRTRPDCAAGRRNRSRTVRTKRRSLSYQVRAAA